MEQDDSQIKTGTISKSELKQALNFAQPTPEQISEVRQPGAKTNPERLTDEHKSVMRRPQEESLLTFEQILSLRKPKENTPSKS